MEIRGWEAVETGGGDRAETVSWEAG